MSRYLSVPRWSFRLSSGTIESNAETEQDDLSDYPRAPSPRRQLRLNEFVRGFRRIPQSIASRSPPPADLPNTQYRPTSDDGTLSGFLSPESPPPVILGRLHDIDIRVRDSSPPIPKPRPNVPQRGSAYSQILQRLIKMPWLAPERITVDWVAATPTPSKSWYTPRKREMDLESADMDERTPSPEIITHTVPIPPPELYITRPSGDPPILVFPKPSTRSSLTRSSPTRSSPVVHLGQQSVVSWTESPVSGPRAI